MLIKRIALIFSVLLIMFSFLSLMIYVKEKLILKNEHNLKVGVPFTDLSTFLVDGHKLGENITHVDDRVFLYSEEGKFYGNRSKIEGAINTKIISTIFNKDTEINYKNEVLTSLDEVKKKLGSNYLEGLPNLGRKDTITYVDEPNNIELIFQGNKDTMIYLKRIEDNLFRTAATPILGFRFDPYNVIFALAYRVKSNYLFNPRDYFYMPLYFSLLLLPIVVLITEKDKGTRKILLLINVFLLITFIMMWIYSSFKMALSG